MVSRVWRLMVLGGLLCLLVRTVQKKPKSIRKHVFTKSEKKQEAEVSSTVEEVRDFVQRLEREETLVVETKEESSSVERRTSAEVPKEEEECKRLASRHGVIPGSSWGTLKVRGQKRWTSLNCDAALRKTPIQKISENQLPGEKAMKAPSHKREFCNKTNTLPLIAVCCGTTTRTKQGWIESVDQLEVLALFQHLLPSVKHTVECGFRYIVVLGYDVGDKFWDTTNGQERARLWFDNHIALPLKQKRNIDINLVLTRVQNSIQKPGPVFTAITKAAYDHKSDYIYRVNDDTELSTVWAHQFVTALAALNNIGAVGPTCDQGNRKILTHDFTHRTHMDIFEQEYYPPALSDWWMDDWISRVYGPTRTLRGKYVHVVHHTFTHGQRYKVDRSHANLLDGLLNKGRARIHSYLEQNNPSLLLLPAQGSPTDQSQNALSPPPGFINFAFSPNRRPRQRGGPVPPRRRRPVIQLPPRVAAPAATTITAAGGNIYASSSPFRSAPSQ